MRQSTEVNGYIDVEEDLGDPGQMPKWIQALYADIRYVNKYY